MGVTGAAAAQAARMQRIRAARAALGRSAATATGADIPTAKPVYRPTGAPQRPAVAAVEQAAEAAPAADVAEVVAAAPVEVGSQRGLFSVGSSTKNFVDDNGNPVIKIGDEEYLFSDGAVTDAMGTVVRTQNPGDLTESVAAPMDNLGASAIEVDGSPTSNLRRKRAAPDTPARSLATRVMGATGEQSYLESVSPATIKKLQKEIDSMSATPEGRQALVREFSNPGLAEQRLAQIAKRAGELSRDPSYEAAKQLDSAAAERAASGKPRTNVAPQPVSATAPLEELADAFNALPDAGRAKIAASLPDGHPLRSLIASSGDTAFIEPNAVAAITRPVNGADDAVGMMLNAQRSGLSSDADAARQLASEAPQEERTAAMQAWMKRRELQKYISEAVNAAGGAVPVTPTKTAAQVAPAPAPLRRAGATSVYTASDLPDNELPGPDATARAAELEHQADVDRRAAGGGLDRKDWLAEYGLDEKDPSAGRKLPFWARGRSDRPEPREVRSRGDRLTNSVETRPGGAIDTGNDLEQEVEEALAELSAARGTADMAKARQRYDRAVSAIDKKYPPRVINLRTGQVRKSPPTAEELAGKLPDGFAVERGRKPMTDSTLNRPGAQQTYDDLVVTMAGARPRPESNLSRSSVDLNAADRQSARLDALDEMGPDTPDEMLPEERELDATPNNGIGKRGRLGGAQQLSREQLAVRHMFGDTNPLTLPRFMNNPDAVATQVLADNTVFKPGTADYDMAHANISRIVQREYSSPPPTPVDPENLSPAPLSSEPAENVATAQDPNAIPREGIRDWRGLGRGVPNVVGKPAAVAAGGSADFSTPAASPAAPTAPVAPATGPVASPVGPVGAPSATDLNAQNLDASAIDLSPPSDAVGGAVPRQRSAKELKAEAKQVYDEAYQQEIDAGSSKADAKRAAKKARDEFLAAESSAAPATPDPVDPVAQPSGAAAAADTADAPPAAAVEARAAQDAVESAARDGVDVAEDADVVDPVGPTTDGTAKPKGIADGTGDGPKPPDTDGTPAPTPAPKRGIGRMLWDNKGRVGIGIGAAVAGLAALRNLGGGNGGFPVTLPDDIPAGGGPPVFVPGGSASPAVPADAASEEALQRALDRIRGARSGSSRPSYQTVQNFNMWG